MYDKFDADFHGTAQQMNILPMDSGVEDFPLGIQISCAQMSQLFLAMGFVRAEGVESEQLMLANIWKQLGGDDNGKTTIPLKRAKIFMCGIQNFHIDWLIDTERPSTTVIG